jgi:ferredoxin
MKVRVDPARCMGHGMCTALAPDVYRINEDSGLNEMGEFTIADDLRDSVNRGLAACPERAISLRDSTPAPTA